MSLRPITSEHLTTLRFSDLTTSDLERMAFGGSESSATVSWWKIEADITCDKCGAYQGVDSDPTNDQAVATELTLRLFNGAGWRANIEGHAVCPDCQTPATDN